MGHVTTVFTQRGPRGLQGEETGGDTGQLAQSLGKDSQADKSAQPPHTHTHTGKPEGASS